jgi:hypothetical protein
MIPVPSMIGTTVIGAAAASPVIVTAPTVPVMVEVVLMNDPAVTPLTFTEKVHDAPGPA